jgi:hypothetical protein
MYLPYTRQAGLPILPKPKSRCDRRKDFSPQCDEEPANRPKSRWTSMRVASRSVGNGGDGRTFEHAAVTIGGIKLAEKIKKDEFKTGSSMVAGQPGQNYGVRRSSLEPIVDALTEKPRLTSLPTRVFAPESFRGNASVVACNSRRAIAIVSSGKFKTARQRFDTLVRALTTHRHHRSGRSRARHSYPWISFVP